MISLSKYLNQTGYQSYAQHVPEHWLHQAAPDPNVQAAIGWIAIMISVPAQICQALVICVFYRSSHLRTTSNKLLISLSVADFLILSMCQLVNVQNLVGLGPILGSLGCKIYGTISSMAALAEIWTLTIVSIDRAQAIFHPIDTLKRMSSAQVHLWIAIIWITASAFAVFPLLGWNEYSSEAYLLGCSFNSFDKSWNARSYIVILIGVAWILPLFVISQRYCCIIYSVRNNIFVTANASAEEERARKVEISLSKMIFVILLVWILAWTPYVILHCWIMFFEPNSLSAEMAIAPSLFCKLSAAVNSLLYGVRLPKFKAAIRKEMKKFWRCMVPQRCLRNSSSKTKVEISSEGQMSEPQNHVNNTSPYLTEANNSSKPALHLVYQSGSIRTVKEATDKCIQTTSV